ncbi:hypothetical protein MUN76_14605 [Leucobacter rhizosphaerae]|uniref:Uncharacterized protein n=1 Tax=Leucobacter rhizosphaerae TaxID=2932245 RepID=A0ABY4FVB1_9MICO|nr:hypothetical protein [Leucobacter rhizosphaerae]UOQ60246.1 hypothetical protein MUN76_14605 [Leucobacter rhizosphaerae]
MSAEALRELTRMRPLRSESGTRDAFIAEHASAASQGLVTAFVVDCADSTDIS